MARTSRTGLLSKLVIATTVIGALHAGTSFAAITKVSLEDDFLQEICDRTEFKRSELNRIQASKYFPQILEYALENCAPVAGALANGASASIVDEVADNTGGTPPGSPPPDDGSGTPPDDGGGTPPDDGGGTPPDDGGGTGGGNKGLGNGDEGDCKGGGCGDSDNPGQNK